jgi:hypothetical protein
MSAVKPQTEIKVSLLWIIEKNSVTKLRRHGTNVYLVGTIYLCSTVCIMYSVNIGKLVLKFGYRVILQYYYSTIFGRRRPKEDMFYIHYFAELTNWQNIWHLVIIY